MFTVCVLLYGNYPDLAKRVLDSLSSTRFVLCVKIGLNAVSETTASFVHDWAVQKSLDTPTWVYQPDGNKNVGKYPLMRRMFKELPTSHVMWFDDDSYLVDANETWWQVMYNAAKRYDVYGCIHCIRQRGKQYAAIPRQPWYTGKAVPSNHFYKFATGGWWIGDVLFLQKWDYPFAGLHHNGGDSILGELVRQQNARLGRPSTLQATCHCEACCKEKLSDISGVHVNLGGRAGRRGIGVTGERYIFADGEPFPPTSHQDFETNITFYGSRHEI